jgi:hypothetical protein
MNKGPRWQGGVYWPWFGQPLMTNTMRESKDTSTLGKMLDEVEKLKRIEAANPIAVEARAERGTIALMERFMRENVPEMDTSIMLQGWPDYFQGIRLREDATVPPRLVRFYDRRGAVIREAVIK